MKVDPEGQKIEGAAVKLLHPLYNKLRRKVPTLPGSMWTSGHLRCACLGRVCEPFRDNR
jgi:hypothetical protein